MGFLISAIDEILRMKALAHQPALHVDLDCENRIDAAFRDILFQLFE